MIMEKPSVLIIEDDRDIVALYRQVLDMAGYQTEIALTGDEAMLRLPQIKPDIVLLDLQLPGVSGVEILKYIREDESLRATPVVVITAYSQVSDNLPVEPDLVLLKPVDIYQLSHLVQRLHVPRAALGEAPIDKVTRLYTQAFFSVRLTFALERVRLRGVQRFGVLFAEIGGTPALRAQRGEPGLNQFLREAADCFKSSLRPTDTMARAEDGYFLSLIEEMRDPQVPVKIAGRVAKSFREFAAQAAAGFKLRTDVGVLICDPGYEEAQAVLRDIDFARTLLSRRPEGGTGIFDREMLHAQRNF
jgi:PleD family two-component response regulator